MASVVRLDQESNKQNGFYVPHFEIRIEGMGLPRDVLEDVTQLTYKDSIKEIDSFELTVNNWDPSTNDFKYVGSETPQSLKGNTPESLRYRLFEPCYKEVEVRMGYVGNLRVMLTGNFTTMEPNFPSSGAPTLTVRGLNILHQLRRKQYTHTWEEKKDSEIAKNIATLRDPQTKKKRFPLSIEIDKNAMNEETDLEYVAQRNQYDIDFLLARARERGYVVFIVEPDPNVSKSKRCLYFGPSHKELIPGLRDVTFELEWGKSLIDFKPTLTTANQIRSVTINGWNRRTRKPIRETVTLDDRKLNVNRDLYKLLQRCDPREEIVVDEPVFTKKQAKKRAYAILRERQKEMIKATVRTVGLPDLRAGQRTIIKGLGSRFSGTYFITETTHTIGDSGYTTRFNARRENNGGGESE
jgi:phage protein D